MVLNGPRPAGFCSFERRQTMSIERCETHQRHWDTDYHILYPICEQEAVAMIDLMINMTKDLAKSASLKGTDVYRSADPNAVITSIYIKKSASAPDNITLIVGDQK